MHGLDVFCVFKERGGREGGMRREREIKRGRKKKKEKEREKKEKKACESVCGICIEDRLCTYYTLNDYIHLQMFGESAMSQ